MPDYYGARQEAANRQRASRRFSFEQAELAKAKRETEELLDQARNEQEQVRMSAWSQARLRYDYHRSLMLEAKAGDS